MKSSISRRRALVRGQGEALLRWIIEVFKTFLVRDCGWSIIVALAISTLRLGYLQQDLIAPLIGSRAAVALLTGLLILAPVFLLGLVLATFCFQQIVTHYWTNRQLGVNPPTLGLISKFDFTQFLRSALVCSFGGYVLASLFLAWWAGIPILRGPWGEFLSFTEGWCSVVPIARRLFDC
jgi:hypothetical protein